MRKKQKWDKKEVSQSFLMISPQLIGFFVFTLYPLCWAIRLSWFNYTGIPSSLRFIGWDNFITIFTKDATYWRALRTTFLFALLKIPIEIPLALVLAVILNHGTRFKGFFRSMYYLPNIVSVAIIGLVFSNMFAFFGVINGLLVKFHIVGSEIEWFSSFKGAMTVIVISSIWQTFGINILYFLAALSNIPTELYECAKLDGANPITTFFKITIPMIAPVFQIILMLSIVGTLQVNDLILVMTNGAPGGQTYTVMPYLVSSFIPGFAGGEVKLGYGCALSVVTACIFASITLIYMKLSAKSSNTY